MQKLIIVIIFSFFCFNVFSQETVIWSDPIPVAESSFNNKGPKLVLNANNEPVVMWGKSGTTGGVYVAKWDGTNFTTPQKINAGITPFINSAEGPQIKSNGDFIFVTFQDQNDDHTGVYSVRSLDGGLTFDAPVQVIPSSDNTNILPFIGIDNNNNPVIGALSAAGQFSTAKMSLSHSTDGGLTYEAPVIASDFSDGPYVCECCPGFLLHDESTEYLFFRNNDNNTRDIWMTFSDDGINYDDGLDIDQFDWTFNVCPASGPQAVKVGEHLLAVHMNAASDVAQVYLSIIDPVTNTLVENKRITNDDFITTVQNFPTPAGAGEIVGVAWEQSTGFDKDIFFTWSDGDFNDLHENVFNITSASDYSQRYPSVAYDGTNFHLIYQEQNDNLIHYRTGTFGIPSGAQEVTASSALKAINTLFHHELLIEVNELTAFAEIVSLDGISIWSVENINSATSIKTTRWASGVYILKFTNKEGSSYYQKLIKQ